MIFSLSVIQLIFFKFEKSIVARIHSDYYCFVSFHETFDKKGIPSYLSLNIKTSRKIMGQNVILILVKNVYQGDQCFCVGIKAKLSKVGWFFEYFNFGSRPKTAYFTKITRHFSGFGNQNLNAFQILMLYYLTSDCQKVSQNFKEVLSICQNLGLIKK